MIEVGNGAVIQCDYQGTLVFETNGRETRIHNKMKIIWILLMKMVQPLPSTCLISHFTRSTTNNGETCTCL